LGRRSAWLVGNVICLNIDDDDAPITSALSSAQAHSHFALVAVQTAKIDILRWGEGQGESESDQVYVSGLLSKLKMSYRAKMIIWGMLLLSGICTGYLMDKASRLVDSLASYGNSSGISYVAR